MKIRDSVNAVMALKKVTKRDLAEGLNLPWNTVNRYLTGQNEISADKFVRILLFLGIDIQETLNQVIKNMLNKEKVNNKNLQSLNYVLDSLDEIDRKVHLDDLIVSARKKYRVRPDPELQTAIRDLREFTK
ncbi:MAG: helix-turn-helix domain-containing protein [Bdellovibrionales bacterium]|nr:helix-turn-helix domain-containing protein [Bdellovibrionales bacterium]